MLELVFAFLCGPLDRLRGDKFHILNLRILDKIAYGLAIAGAAGLFIDPVAMLLVAVAMIAGMSPGWGTPYGSFIGKTPMSPTDQEWWQVGVLKTNALAALIARGALWGLPIVPVAFYLGNYELLWIVPIFTVAFPLALWLATKLPKTRDQWADSELIRGWLVGAAILVLI